MIDYTKNLYAETEEEAIARTKIILSVFLDISEIKFDSYFSSVREHTPAYFKVSARNEKHHIVAELYFYCKAKYSKFEPSKVMPN